MTELYRIHFGFSNSKRYPQAVELSELAFKHEVRGEGEDAWHIVSFTDDQLDLMAALYKIARNLTGPKVYEVNALTLKLFCLGGRYAQWMDTKPNYDRILLAVEKLKRETGKSGKELANLIEEKYLKSWQNDMVKVNNKLREEGYLKSSDLKTGRLRPAWKKPKEHFTYYKEIRDHISKGEYEEAVKKYYATLGSRIYGELHGELIYLKRLGNVPLKGKDLLFYRTESTRTDLINADLSEYVDCIDQVLEERQSAGLINPVNILIENAATMEELIKKREYNWHKGVYLWKGKFETDTTPVTIDSFSAQFDKCLEGRLFDRYPDQVWYCKVIEYPEDQSSKKLWTTYSPSFYQEKILDKGLHLVGIDAYKHKKWGWKKRDPDFTTVVSLGEIEKSEYGTKGIHYTGRSHKIEGKTFYEIDLKIRHLDFPEEIENPFLELMDEILREAENLLRERHGLPRIGEGWISEMELYQIVKKVFDDAEHHVSPSWLKPQHLDVLVPSKKIAFEYQGIQHFEPLDFFGGDEAFEKRQKLDTRKARKCKSNGVVLIYWRYDEPIIDDVLDKKLNELSLRLPGERNDGRAGKAPH
jgi:hypothetical protein